MINDIFVRTRLQVSPPGIEWKTGRKPKMEENWHKKKKENGPRPEIGKKWPKNGEKNRKMTPNPIFFAICGPFFLHFGPPFSIFQPIFLFSAFGPLSVLHQAG